MQESVEGAIAAESEFYCCNAPVNVNPRTPPAGT